MSLWSKWNMQEYPLYSNRRTHTNGYENYELVPQDQRVVFAKNTRTYHLHFSLNRKCRNTYFTLIEEQPSIVIQLSLSHSYSLIYQGEAYPLKGSSHPWAPPIGW